MTHPDPLVQAAIEQVKADFDIDVVVPPGTEGDVTLDEDGNLVIKSRIVRQGSTVRDPCGIEHFILEEVNGVKVAPFCEDHGLECPLLHS